MENLVRRAEADLRSPFAGWSGRPVFVTGHTGFKGAWLCLWLARLGAKLTGYALPAPSEPSLFALGRVSEGMRSVIGELADLGKLAAEMQAARPEVVFHLAAQSLVRRSYADPVGTYATNVLGTAHVLEAVRRTPSVRAVVIVTTDKCYENLEWPWGYRESDRLGGRDPYSNSKACAELVTQSFRDSFFSGASGRRVAIASARAGNVIGGGDWAEDRVLPDFVRAISKGEPVHIRRPEAVRPWQHVLDPLHGYLLLAEKLLSDGEGWAQAWNFGPEESDARNVRWLVERFSEIWGPSARWTQDAGEHPHEAGMLRLDISKARQQLGWRPAWNVERALERTAHWYRAQAKGADARTLTLEQIDEYQAARQAVEKAA